MGRKELNTYLMASIIRARIAGLNVDVHFIPMKPNYSIKSYKEFIAFVNCLYPGISKDEHCDMEI